MIINLYVVVFMKMLKRMKDCLFNVNILNIYLIN